MRRRLIERNDLTAPKQPTQLCLFGGTACLGHDWAGHERHQTRFEANAVLRPHATLIPFGSDQDAGVV